MNCVSNANVWVYDKVKPNPEVQDIENIKDTYAGNISSIIALGGGSVLDTAKVLSLWLACPQHSFEQLTSQRASDKPLIPLIAIPTTAGTGAEVTPFATVWEASKGKKHSLIGLRPSHVILDAQLTVSLPAKETLYSAMDALSHGLESLWNINQTLESKEYAENAIFVICENLPLVIKEPQNISAREQLQLAATYAGLAITTTKTAVAHAISYPITMQFGVPHGLACSFTLLSIINTYGHEKLNLSTELADKVRQLIDSLDLAAELNDYVDYQTLVQQLNINLDPSRAGNFIVDVEDVDVVEILTSAMV
jgi:alcohol dehydrogenase